MNLYLFFVLPIPGDVLWPGLAAVNVYTMSPGRIGAIVAGLLALTGLLVGGQALRRQKKGTGTGQRGAFVALVTGLVGVVLGVSVVATSAGGLGTGNGRGGGYVAIVLGTIALTLGRLALVRARRTRETPKV